MHIFSLKNQKSFDFVQKKATKIHGKFFIAIISKPIPLNHESRLLISGKKSFEKEAAFLGMKVSRRFAKKAVIRNKARRRIRHLLRNLVNKYPDSIQNRAIIIIPKKGMDKTKFSALNYNFQESIRSETN